MNKLDRITKSFGNAYVRKTKAESWLEQQRSKMFETFTQELSNHSLSRKSVRACLKNQDPFEWVRKYHPGWKLIDITEDDEWFVLEEDPALLKYTYTNHETGMVYGRDISTGSPSLDDEILRQEDPDLWQRITVWPEPWYSLVKEVIISRTSLPWSQDALDVEVGAFLEKKGLQRVLKDFSKIHPTDLVDLQTYIIPGKITVKIKQPKPIKVNE